MASYLASPFPKQHFRVGEEIKLTYMFGSSPNCVMCRYFGEEAQQLDAIMQEIVEYVATPEKMVPEDDSYRIGFPLLAKSQTKDMWYRAEILAVSDDEELVTVEYVDRGIIDTISSMDTLPIAPQHAELRKQAVPYAIRKVSGARLKLWSNQIAAQFESVVRLVDFIPATVLSTKGDVICVKYGPVAQFIESLECSDL